MMEQLEADLRDALAEHAAQIPTGAITARLRQIDYHPRSPRLRPALAIGTVAGLAMVAGVSVSIVGLGAGTQPAFAGWSATPTAASGGQTAAAEAACLARLPSSADAEQARSDGTAHAPVMESLLKIAPSEWHAVLTDTRGPYTMLILEAGKGQARASCFSSGSSPALISVGPGSGEPIPPPAGQVQVSSFGSQAAVAGHPYSTTEGHVGAGVTGVTMVLQDGTNVAATIANGWFLAWWPGSQEVVADEVSTASGTTTSQIQDPASASGGHIARPGAVIRG